MRPVSASSFDTREAMAMDVILRARSSWSIKYYNGCLFHAVQKDFTAQTGDPTGTGTGGDSVYKFLYGDQARFFSDEIHLDLKHSKTGTVAMASAGENLNASQFYFTLRDGLDYLDGKHTVFGEVAEGLDTLTRINEAYVDEKNRPYKIFELIPDSSPEGKPKDEVDDEVRLEDDWVSMDEQLGPVELEEVLRAKEAHSSAVVLESIGDIPDAEIKPPENVLFVCKLNPVTEDEDLHTIFSRFGTVVLAEIIRDYKTGDSLCYAFIGGGCFKCGAPDHIAKYCAGGPANKQLQPPKYVLKDDNLQRGGNNNSRYEMVFDGDTPESPRQEMRIGRHDPERERKYRTSSEDLKHRDEEKKYSSDRHRHSGHKEDDRHHQRKKSKYPEERIDRRKERDDDRRDDREYRKRSSDTEGCGDEREKESYRKRTAGDESRRGELGDGTDSKRRYVDGDRRDTRDEPSYRNYDCHRGRREGREYRYQGRESGDDHDTRHRSDRRR
ncbi:hypothetical protein GH714_039517 [Hevea brasiliensis]|uniref:Peptidyl-prolyl cis-trans isomerase n=1 Tax=Hevea brasiliensis TaxID=3981 RepID=A0A6A6MVW8_HEVBR|nr:hypothetical protein GH714_039517 [Hevea brasiliensis]